MFFTTTLRLFNIVKVLTFTLFKLVLITLYVQHATLQPGKVTEKDFAGKYLHYLLSGEMLVFLLANPVMLFISGH